MPNPSLTEIVVLLDRSGSMSSIKNDMIGGFGSFIKEQQAQPGDCEVSLYTFDTEHETAYEGVPVSKVQKLILQPRGGTALYDAVAKTIFGVGARYAAQPEDKRPGKVVFLIITDGQENSSREYNRHMVKELIEHQTKTYAWQFAFLGANIDAAAEAATMGLSSAQAMNYVANPRGVAQMYGSAARAVSNYRRSAGGQSLTFEPEDDQGKS